MSLVTRKQQDIIDEAIGSYIRNYDKTAQQYLKLRQEIYETTTSIIKQTTTSEDAKVSAQDKIKLGKLQYEYSKVSEAYKLHITRLEQNLEVKSSISPPYLSELESQYNALSERRTKLESNILDVKNNQKPLVDDMKALLTNFQNETSGGKRAKPKFFKGPEDLVPKAGSRTINLGSSVFTHDELKALLIDVDSKLKKLKTVDEVGDDVQEETVAGTTRHSLDIISYLNEHIQNNKAYKNIGDDQYLYDISKTKPADMVNSTAVLDENDKAIESLTVAIKDLIEHGAQAKERWSANAKKLESIKHVLHEDSMEVDNS